MRRREETTGSASNQITNMQDRGNQAAFAKKLEQELGIAKRMSPEKSYEALFHDIFNRVITAKTQIPSETFPAFLQSLIRSDDGIKNTTQLNIDSLNKALPRDDQKMQSFCNNLFVNVSRSLDENYVIFGEEYKATQERVSSIIQEDAQKKLFLAKSKNLLEDAEKLSKMYIKAIEMDNPPRNTEDANNAQSSAPSENKMTVNEDGKFCTITYYERVPKENGMGYEFKERRITDLTLTQTRNLAELWNGEAGWNYCKEKGIEWHPVDISNNFFNDGFRLRFDNKELKNEFITGFREKILGNQKTSIAEKAASANGTVTPANPAPTPSALPAIPGLTQ